MYLKGVLVDEEAPSRLAATWSFSPLLQLYQSTWLYL